MDLHTTSRLTFFYFGHLGHSLGAHVCGFAGKTLRNSPRKHRFTLDMIIGLDPAGPIFELNHPEMKLFKNDAKVVQVFHTNAGQLGHQKPLGTYKD